jgi:hypothetical protein
MPIIKRKDIYDDSKKAFKNLNKELDNLDKKVKDLTKSNNDLATSLQNVKKSNDGKEAKALVTITNDLNKSTKEINDTRKEAEKLQKQLKSLTDEEVKAKLKFNEANKKQRESLKALNTLEDKEAGTLEKLRARNKQLAIERNKLNLETKKGRDRLKEINAELDKNNKKLKKNADALSKQKINIGNYVGGLVKMGVQLLKTGILMVGLRGAITGIKDIIGATAEGQLFLAKVTGATNTIMATFRDKIIDGWNSLIDFGKEIDSTRTLLEKLSDGLFDFYSVRGAGFLKFIDAGSQILKGDFKDALTTINDAFVQIATGVESATEKTRKQLELIERMAVFGAQIAAGEKKLELERSEFAIKEAKDLRTIAELRVVAANKTKNTAKEREEALTQAIALTIALGNKNEEFANRELAFQQAVFNANKSNIDDEIELNKLKQKADEVKASALKKEKLLTLELQTAKNEAAKQDIDNISNRLLKQIEADDKDEEAALKTEERLLAEMEAVDEAADNFVLAEQLKQNEISKTKDESDAAAKKLLEQSQILVAASAQSGQAIGELMAQGLLTFKEFSKILLKTTLDLVQRQVNIWLVGLLPRLILSLGPIAGPIAFGALVIAINAGIATAKAGIASFNEGIEYVPGTGNKDTVPAILTPGERVVPAEINKRLNGIPNSALPDLLNKQENNMLVAGLLMKGNQNSSDMIELLGRLGLVYKRGNENYIERATGQIERFI